jgi:trk system potassium uptake protein TrkA
MKYRLDVLVCTIEKDDEVVIANGDTVFEEKDVVSIVASNKNATEFFKKIGYEGHSVKNAMIVGGGIITKYLCGILERSNVSLKVIEKDRKVCEELSSAFPKVCVIHGDCSEKEILLEEGLESTGAFVALCGLDEENILLSVFAKGLGCDKLITKISRVDYDNVINRLDLDTTVCPRNITANFILRYVRAMKNTRGSNVETLYNIIQDKVEACEFIVRENSPIAGVPLAQLKFKKDILIASISRGDSVIIPRGSDVIEAGDLVVIVSKQKGLNDVKDVLR